MANGPLRHFLYFHFALALERIRTNKKIGVAKRGGAARGGRGGARGGAKGGAKVTVEPHRHEGIFVAHGKEDYLLTKNLVPGESVYGEKRISIEVRSNDPN